MQGCATAATGAPIVTLCTAKQEVLAPAHTPECCKQQSTLAGVVRVCMQCTPPHKAHPALNSVTLTRNNISQPLTTPDTLTPGVFCHPHRWRSDVGQ